jgi:hypothetical protein
VPTFFKRQKPKERRFGSWNSVLFSFFFRAQKRVTVLKFSNTPQNGLTLPAGGKKETSLALSR